ncbi:hypothetical protein H9L39_18755 [Fusarium oxysporum f. sp. albedinis]|nr:hypothetical protein H9L39_18755 [Fusarium oxysporum f. sp. albedinis]
MLLLDLPNELLNSIAYLLESERDISAFSQANRCLYELLTPHLYRHNAQCSGSSALLWAVEHGQNAMVQYSVAQGGDVHVSNDQGQTPLLLAAKNRHIATVRFLLDEDAEKDSKDSDDRTLLSWAAAGGDESIVQLFLDRDTEATSKDDYGQTPLSKATAGSQRTDTVIIGGGGGT